MKQIAVLANSNSISSDLFALLDYFEYCNVLWALQQPTASAPLFHCYLVSPDSQPLRLKQGVQLPVQQHAWQQADAVILPAAYAYHRNELAALASQSAAYYPGLRQVYQRGSLIAASCTGTYILAGSGLLDHRKATSSWFFKDVFQSLFPDVHLQLNKLLVQDGNLLTAGATTSYINLCLAITEQLAGEQFARQMAKIMLTDPNRTSQVPYMDLSIGQQHNDSLIKQLQAHLAQQLAAPFALEALAQQFHLTKRTLLRRFKAALDDTPLNYLQRLRVEQAKRLLETTNQPIEQIVLQVGYEDVSSFRKLFLQYTELTPSQYRQKFSQGETFNCCPVEQGASAEK
ncbi:GlxA family transcriptional regulator [Rheinheimera maricola]|uniref:Helix-turn-helix domain-containing protein n=1 Tax=Rheinheimera maricola TaxID=2793282 RepID=A0ABS7X4M5_9GAMM|nr:helix-turn-helix domain-containing protein [Rheinheimera maricola]MBZ9610489.1 helix-turn-helix domain-containing protein [Rheinheimera maricola]